MRPPSAVVWDNHACMPLRADDSMLPQLERYRAAGVTVVSLNVGFAQMSWAEHLRILSFMRRWISLHHDRYRLVSTVEDVHRCRSDGRLGIVFDVEGMGPVEQDLSLVQTFYELGTRWMLIAYNKNSAAGGGCMDADPGLTQLGRRIIDEMERVGMVLCLSHAGSRTVADALDYVRNPPIFSHSNPYGRNPHVRNVSDQLLKRCAEKGGVIGLSGIGAFIGTERDLVSKLIDQLKYVIDLVGPKHVGLGLDYVFDRKELDDFLCANPGLFPPNIGGAMLGPEDTSEIAEGLARQNLTDGDIRGVMGGNWLRIAAQVWR